MPFAVEMYMDSVAEASVWKLCESISEAGLSSFAQDRRLTHVWLQKEPSHALCC